MAWDLDFVCTTKPLESKYGPYFILVVHDLSIVHSIYIIFLVLVVYWNWTRTRTSGHHLLFANCLQFVFEYYNATVSKFCNLWHVN